MAEEKKWITVKGTSIPLDEEGNLQGKVGKKIEKETEISEKKQKIKNALQEIADGKEEVTLPKLRDDLEQYGGTNDITLIKGNKKEGIIHIIENGREHYLGDILDTVVEGKVERYVQGNNSVVLQKGNIQAVLALERFREKKTWLLTGWDITTDRNKEKQEYLKKKGLVSDEQGKFGARHLPTQTEPIRSRFCLGADKDLIEIINNIKKKSTDSKAMGRQNIIMDSQSKRTIDRNGFMHVELCNITKESVDPYFGREIPKYRELGLDPETIYYGWRKGEELKKAARTFCGLPLMREHHFDSSEAPQREHRVGSVGTDCAWKAPYLTASLTVTDAEAIRKIESGERMELSSGYFFTPVFEKGEWNGQPYDFIMTDIQGNHVALVPEGRAGSDVCVADSNKLVQEILKPRRGSAVFSAQNTSDSECQKGRLTERYAVDTAENIKPIKNNEDKAMSQMEKEKPVPAADMETAAGAVNAASKDTKTVCDADNAENKTAEQPAQDEDMDLEDILQAAGITPSDELKKVFMAGMQYAAKKQEQPAQPASEPAKDEDMKQPEPKTSEKPAPEQPAMDANTIKKQIREEMRGVQIAMREVRPLVGDLDAVTFDSAEGVYLKACELMGVAASKITARDVCRALAVTGKNPQAMLAVDSADYGFKSRFEI